MVFHVTVKVTGAVEGVGAARVEAEMARGIGVIS